MFKITLSQMTACSEVSAQSFADKLTRHLVEAVPSHSEVMGTSALRGMVERGITRAASHGITAQKDVCLFLAVTSALGEGFDTDPALPWAADVLGPENPLDASTKARQLWTVVESDVLPEGAPDGSGAISARPSAAIAMALAEAARTDLASPLPVDQPVAPCPLRPRFYRFSL
ncbi:hypothetical protein WMF38_50620 [Sorangium sp. So ce118]